MDIDLDAVEEKTRKWAEMQGLYEELEKFLKDKTVQNKKQLIIDAYEAINTLKRVDERELLNIERFKAHEQNRPPSDKWYALKGKTFCDELHRNAVALKPNNANDAYLTKLRDQMLY
jgi:hypothetical protein